MPSTLSIWLAALTTLAALNVSAQPVPAAPMAAAAAASAARATNTTQPGAAASAPASAAVVAPRPTTSPGTYRSVFEGYQAFGDENVRPWKESNDTVGSVGGWRVYAKEAAQASDVAPGPSAPASAARSGQAKP